MLKPINSTDEFFARLEKEGKVRILNSPEDYKRQKEMNEGLMKAKRDFLEMDALSNISARERYIFC